MDFAVNLVEMYHLMYFGIFHLLNQTGAKAKNIQINFIANLEGLINGKLK